MSPDSVVFQLAFACLCITVLVAPFVPAWLEWQYPTDDKPLDVSVKLTSDTPYLALQFRDKVVALLAQNGPARYERIEQLKNDEVGASTMQSRLPVVVSNPAFKGYAIDWGRPVYAAGDLYLGGPNALAEAFSEGHMALGPQSLVSGWAHAEKRLTLGRGCVAAGRLSSAQAIYLDHGCCFERMHAPMVHFGTTPRDAEPLHPAATPMPPGRLAGATAWGESGWRIEGDCVIPEAHHFTGSLVVTGVLTLERGAVVEGDVKAHKGVVIGEGARVTGAVTCESGVHVLHGGSAGGPLVSESHLLLQSHAVLGSPEALTTVSADSIVVEQGVVAHGTVWARRVGIVLEPA